MKNYYEVLEISESADSDEIKKAYRKLTKQYHPDRNPDGEEHFKKIVEAYETLGDSSKRADYDRTLNGGSVNDYFTTFHDFSFNGFDPSHLNIVRDRKFSLSELMAGVEFTVDYQVSKSGLDKSSFDNKSYKIKVNLSKTAYPITQIGGSVNAVILRIKGAGSSQVFERSDFFGKARQNSVSGDLIVRVIIDLQGLYIRDFDIVQTTHVELSEVLFSDEIILENSLGKKYRIKSLMVNSLSDIRVRIPDHGLFMPNGTNGAFIFEIKVNKPDLTKLSEEELTKLRELLKGFDK